MAARGAGLKLTRRLLSSGGRTTSGPVRGSGPPNGFFGEGVQEGRNGFLYGETPPPPGQARKWESWEAPLYGPHSLSDSHCFLAATSG